MKKQNKEEENSKEDKEQENKIAREEEIKTQNKTLKNVMIFLVVTIASFAAVVLLIHYLNSFSYEEVKFDIIKEGRIILYNTKFPVYSSITGKQIADYNFYLRNDPRELEKIPFDGVINLRDIMVLNITEGLNCDGDGIIAVANFIQILESFGIKIMKDPNATCDDIYGRYNFIRVIKGNETRINEFGFNGGCYNFVVKDCEILPVTEKFLVETFIKFKDGKLVK